MTDTTAAPSSSWLAALRDVTSWKHVAAIALVALGSLAYFGKLPSWPASTETVTMTALSGAQAKIFDLEMQMESAAGQADIAELKAVIVQIDKRIAGIEKVLGTKPAVTTGSISKPSKK